MDQASAILDEKSSTSGALATHDGQVLLAWTGSNHRINTLRSANGRVFGDKQTFAHRSSRTVWVGSGKGAGQSTMSTEPLAPALAVAPWREELALAWTGTDQRLNIARFAGKVSWAG